ncbi:unnamed protein product [Closterium sp. Naga37s-1]|nr:unnamed protein product [Closterium sp. Naga37s-1]
MAVTSSTSIQHGAHHRRVWSLICCRNPATHSFYGDDADTESSTRGDAQAAAAPAEKLAEPAHQVRGGDDGTPLLSLKEMAEGAVTGGASRAKSAARDTGESSMTLCDAPIDDGAGVASSSDLSSSVSTSALHSAFSAAGSPFRASSGYRESAASAGATPPPEIMDMWKSLEAPTSPKNGSAAPRKMRAAHSADASFLRLHHAAVRVEVPHSPANLSDSAVSPTNSEAGVPRTPGGTYLSFSTAPSPRTLQCAYSLQTGALIVTPGPSSWAAIGGNGGARESERPHTSPGGTKRTGGIVGWEQEALRWEETEQQRLRVEGEVRGMVAHLMGELRAVSGAAQQLAEPVCANVAERCGEDEIATSGEGRAECIGAERLASVSAAARAVRLLVKSSDANRSIVAAVPGAIGALVGVADALLLAESARIRGGEGRKARGANAAGEAERRSEHGGRSEGQMAVEGVGRSVGEAERGEESGGAMVAGRGEVEEAETAETAEPAEGKKVRGAAESSRRESAREAVGHAVTALLNLSLSPATHGALLAEGAVDALSRLVARPCCPAGHHGDSGDGSDGDGGSTGGGSRGGGGGEGRRGHACQEARTGEEGACRGDDEVSAGSVGLPSVVSQEARENAAAALFMLTSSPLPPSLSSAHSTSLSSSTSSLTGPSLSTGHLAVLSSSFSQQEPLPTGTHTSNPNATPSDPPSTALNPFGCDPDAMRRRVAATPGAIAGLVHMLPPSPARSLRGRKDAALTLFNLSLCADLVPVIIAAGAVCPLVRMLEEEEGGMRLGLEEKAAAVLARLAQAKEGSRQIVAAGGIPPLVELLGASSTALGASPSMASLAELSAVSEEGAGGGGGGSVGSGVGEQQRWRRVQKDVGAVLVRVVEEEGAQQEMLEEGALLVLRKMRHRGSSRARLTLVTSKFTAMATETFLFTSESVNEGHPDKLCDQVSDAVLDACLEQDPDSKVACESCTKTNMVMIFGEITTKAKIDYEKIVRDTVRNIGFVSDDVGLDCDKCNVLINIEQQSPDIGQGVHGMGTKKPEEVGAGDQGHMFGYATDETPELMPLTHVLATQLGAKLTEVRKNGVCPWLRPDGKTQVTVEYKNEGGAMVPIRVHTVLISTQHDETVTNEKIAADLKEHVITPVIPAKYLDDNTIFHLNPSGRFVIGGPHGDAGLTGRKIIIDTYGGWGAHGGGAFSGKDPTKVDRSGAYVARQAAKSIVAAGLARRALTQVSYAIGVPEPLSIFVDTYGTGKIPDKEILELVKEAFDFRPGMISINLDLKKGGNKRYQKTAAYGHFGRDDPDFTWEVVKELKPKTAA